MSTNIFAEHLKVDISTTGQPRGHAQDFTQWIMPINSGSTRTTKFGSVTVRLDMTSPHADATHYLKCRYANKDGQTYNFKLSYDDLPDWWESANHLNCNGPADDFSDANGDTDIDGYTNIEEYFNYLADGGTKPVPL